MFPLQHKTHRQTPSFWSDAPLKRTWWEPANFPSMPEGNEHVPETRMEPEEVKCLTLRKACQWSQQGLGPRSSSWMLYYNETDTPPPEISLSQSEVIHKNVFMASWKLIKLEMHHHCSLLRLNPEMFIGEVSISKKEARVWNVSGHSTGSSSVPCPHWVLNALSPQKKVPWGLTWPGAGQPLWPQLLAHLPFYGSSNPRLPGFLFCPSKESRHSPSAPPSFVVASCASSVRDHVTRGILGQSLKALALPTPCLGPNLGSIIS